MSLTEIFYLFRARPKKEDHLDLNLGLLILPLRARLRGLLPAAERGLEMSHAHLPVNQMKLCSWVFMKPHASPEHQDQWPHRRT